MPEKLTVSFDSEQEMLGFLKTNGTQCRFVSMTSKTPVTKMRVDNPFHRIKSGKVVGEVGLWKVSQKMGLINANYNTSVRRRIAEKLGVKLAEVEYENGEVYYQHLMTNDTPAKALPVVRHKDEVKFLASGHLLQYFPHSSESTYCNAAGEPVDYRSQIAPYMYAQSEREDFKPQVLAVYLRNIVRLVCSGVVVEMPNWEQAKQLLAEA